MKKSINTVINELNDYIKYNMGMLERATLQNDSSKYYEVRVNSDEQVVYDFMKTYFHYENYEVISRTVLNREMVLFIEK